MGGKGLSHRQQRTFRALVGPILGVAELDASLIDDAVARLDAYVQTLPEVQGGASLRQLFDVMWLKCMAEHSLTPPWKLSDDQLRKFLSRLFGPRTSAFEKVIDWASIELRTGMTVLDLGKSLREMCALAYYSNPRTNGLTGYVPPWHRGAIWSRPDVLASGVSAPIAPTARIDVQSVQNVHAAGHPYDVERLFPAGAGPRVAVIGSGAGGAPVAMRLAAAGCRVGLFEAGPRLLPHQYPTDTLVAMSLLFEQGLLTLSKDLDIHLLRGRVVGGSTVMTSGMMIPIRPHMRKEWQDIAGIDAQKLDAALELVGKRTRVQKLRDDQMTSTTEAFRDGVRASGRTIEEPGFYVGGDPRTIPPAKVAQRAGDYCLACGMCNYGCKYGHKFGADVAYVLRAEQEHRANFRVNANLPIDWLEAERDGNGALRITALHTEKRASTPALRVPLDYVVLAGGAVGTPALVLRSAQHGALSSLPGIRDKTVGAGLGFNYGSGVVATLKRGLPRPADTGFQVRYVGLESPDDGERDWYVMEHAFVPPSLVSNVVPGIGADHLAAMRNYRRLGMAVNTMAYTEPARPAPGPDGKRPSVTSGRSSGRVHADRSVEYSIAPGSTEFERILDSLSHVVRAYLCDARVEEVGLAGVRDTGRGPTFVRDEWLGKSAAEIRDELAAHVKKTDMLMLSSGHPLGGMGIRHDSGPVTPDFRLRGTSNAWVSDASVFPGPIVVNPQWTVFAIGEMAADAIVHALAPAHPQLDVRAGATD